MQLFTFRKGEHSYSSQTSAFSMHIHSCGFSCVRLALAADAQKTSKPKYEIGLNYSWLHVNSANYDYQRTGNGGSGYFAYNLNNFVGLVADFDGYANTRTGINDTLMTYMFGPRFNWRHSKLTPYVQFLFGGAYVWNSPAWGPFHHTERLRHRGGRRFGLSGEQPHSH